MSLVLLFQSLIFHPFSDIVLQSTTSIYKFNKQGELLSTRQMSHKHKIKWVSHNNYHLSCESYKVCNLNSIEGVSAEFVNVQDLLTLIWLKSMCRCKSITFWRKNKQVFFLLPIFWSDCILFCKATRCKMVELYKSLPCWFFFVLLPGWWNVTNAPAFFHTWVHNIVDSSATLLF